jgi:hypothetical protein
VYDRKSASKSKDSHLITDVHKGLRVLVGELELDRVGGQEDGGALATGYRILDLEPQEKWASNESALGDDPAAEVSDLDEESLGDRADEHGPVVAPSDCLFVHQGRSHVVTAEQPTTL